MKLTIQKRDIEFALIKAIPFLENKDMTAVTSNISILLENDTVCISATDYEIGLKTTIQTLGVIENGSAIVNGKKLLDFIKVLKNDNINFECKGEFLHINQGRSKFKVALFNGGEFPKFPSADESKEIIIDSNILIDSFRQIAPTIANNNPKYELNGALISINKDSISFNSTDTKRLSYLKIDNKSDNELDIIIPKKAILEIQKLFFEDIKIYCNSSYMTILSDSFTFFTKLINGKYPDVNRVIPKDIKHSINILKLPFTDAIKQVNTVSIEVGITIEHNKMIFSSVGDNNNNAITDIDIEFNSDEKIDLVVNSKFLLDFLSVVYDNEFHFGINEANMPFILSSADLKTIVMPVTL